MIHVHLLAWVMLRLAACSLGICAMLCSGLCSEVCEHACTHTQRWQWKKAAIEQQESEGSNTLVTVIPPTGFIQVLTH